MTIPIASGLGAFAYWRWLRPTALEIEELEFQRKWAEINRREAEHARFISSQREAERSDGFSD